jgi:hypothetical protein
MDGAWLCSSVFSWFNQRFAKMWFPILTVGLGLFTAAFAMTLAIYRCPVCDKYLNKYRPDKRNVRNAERKYEKR